MIRENREYRNFKLNVEERKEGEEPSYIAEGYATTFEPYIIWEEDGVEYKEQILPTAFDKDTDMSDVIFVKDHAGTVFARTKNKLLNLNVDEEGLKVRVDLSKTAAAREMFEEIKVGNYTQMSFAFIVDDDEYDSRSHTRIIRHLKKLFDVSAVSFPANPGTDISPATRSRFDGFIEAEKAERLERQKQLELEKAKYEYFRRN